jgi:hypothetical protein
MAQAVSRWPLTVAAWVHAQVNPVGFVVVKVALGQVFLRVLRFSRQYHSTVGSTFSKIEKKNSSLIHLPLHSSSSGDGQKACKSRHSPVRHQSHPHNQKVLREENIQNYREKFLKHAENG